MAQCAQPNGEHAGRRILRAVLPVRSRGRRQSVTSKLVGLARANAAKAALPKCGAKTRQGEVCQNPGTGAGGRCPMHGGKTPSGKNWHVAVLPAAGPRLERKLAALAKRRRERAAEIAAMDPARRAKYDAWCATHKAGGPAGRERARRDREMAQFFQKPPPERPIDPRLEALAARLQEIRLRRAVLEAQIRDQQIEDEENDG